MWGRGGVAALAACALALAAAPAASASQAMSRGDYQFDYVADPLEANRFKVSDRDASGAHIRDSGAAIRWIPDGPWEVPHCVGAAQDVWCSDLSWRFQMFLELGDGDDTFVNRSQWGADVELGPGDDKAVGGDTGYILDGGPGADDLHGGAVNDDLPSFPEAVDAQAVTYWRSPAGVHVTADDVANDGVPGEGDNVHSDVYEVGGTPYDDTLSGYRVLGAGPGNDTLIGTAGEDNLFYARNDAGFVDHVWCGGGHDLVYADAQDVIHEENGVCDDLRNG